MRSALRRTVLTCLLLVFTSGSLSLYWWTLGATTTQEVYLRYCGGAAECYPEAMFLMGALGMGFVALGSAVVLLILMVSRFCAWIATSS
jgi:hypothetical protein